MPLNIIKDQCRIQGSEPNGDSLNFHPDDRTAFSTLQLVRMSPFHRPGDARSSCTRRPLSNSPKASSTHLLLALEG